MWSTTIFPCEVAITASPLVVGDGQPGEAQSGAAQVDVVVARVEID